MVKPRFMALCRSTAVTTLLAVMLALTCSPVACGQTKPRPPGRDITTGAGPFNDEQVAAIKTFAEFWCTQLTSKNSTPEQVQEARNELVKPLAAINAPSPAFRAEFASILVKSLRPGIIEGSSHAATNAVVVVSQLGTRGALTLLLDASIDQQAPWQTRLAAAQGCVTAVKAAGLQPKEILDAVRRMKDATRDESNALIVRYRFEAMVAAADNPSLTPADREKIRSGDLPDAVQNVVDRINQNVNVPNPVFGSLQWVVFKVYRLLIDNKLSAQEAHDIGVKMGPDLVTAIDIARQQWEAAHADPELAREYGLFIKSSEELLKRLDAEVRRDVQQRPQTQLQGAWNEKKKDQFDADTKKWQDVVSQPPYANK